MHAFPRYTRERLETLPTLAIGQAEDLHVEDLDRGVRIWLRREFPHWIEVECWSMEEGWRTTERYLPEDCFEE